MADSGRFPRHVPLPGEAGDEEALMERLQGGEPSALDEVIRCYWHALVAYAARLTPSEDAAEDVVQEAMLRVWRGRRQWNASDRLASFLYRITRNLALDETRRRRVRERWAEEEGSREQAGPPTPDQIAEHTQVSGAVTRAIEALPPRRREVFVLSRYHGHSYREIAEIMEISPQTVANQMSAALDELRERLSSHLPDPQPALAPTPPSATPRLRVMNGREDQRIV
jgi:RNA polymerase sigma-70 factor (family 1)